MIQSQSSDQIKFRDIDGFYNFEAHVNGIIIATISINTSEKFSYWVVEVNGVEVHRCSYLYSEATDLIKTAYANVLSISFQEQMLKP